VVGLTQAAGASEFDRRGSPVLGAVTQQPSETVPSGEVLSQSPVAGTSVAVGSAVSLVVSSGPPITEIPTDGLVIALRASGLAGSLANGDPVTQWFSEEGSGGTAVGSGLQAPTFALSAINGQPAVRFDGVDDFLALTGSLSDFRAGVSLYVVMRPTVLQSGFKVLLLGNGAGAQNIGLGRAGTDPGYQYFTFSDSGAVGFFNTSGGLVANEPALVSVLQAAGVSNGTSAAELAKNGTVIGGGDVAVPALADRLDNLIGKSRFGGDGFFQGDIAEILIYNRALSATEQATVRGYFAQKYSLSIAGPQPVTVPTRGEPDAGECGSGDRGGGPRGGHGDDGVRRVGAGGQGDQPEPGGWRECAAGHGGGPGGVAGCGAGDGADVVSLTQANAEAAIVAAGLVVGTVTTAYDASVPAGNVISQNPAGGGSALPGTAVDLVVSLGVAPVGGAERGEPDAGECGSGDRGGGPRGGHGDDGVRRVVPAGNVISQNPAGGGSALPGTAVDLVVSLGVAPVTVPSVVSLTQANAEAAIVAAGLVVGTVTTAYDASVPAGNVISQNPAGGGSALPGTAVDLVVSLGVAPVGCRAWWA
jgi:beta-lactam-binding protein with PASTA domain